VAICGSASDSAGHAAGFFAVASADGKLETIVRTEPYVPTAVSIAPDGSIWTKGAEFVPVKRTAAKTDRGVIRHFDRTGKFLGDFLPQSSLSRAQLFLGIDQLASNSKRIGWYQGQGAAGYFEVVRDRVDRYPIVNLAADEEGAQISGLTVLENDAVFVTRSVRGSDPEVYVLRRDSGNWARITPPAQGPPETTNWLLGGSGNMLVFKTMAQSSWLRRFEVRAR
jgi:hypothetical protein